MRELILELYVRLFDLCLFGFVFSSSSWCLGGAAVYDCGVPWAFLLPLFLTVSFPEFSYLLLYISNY